METLLQATLLALALATTGGATAAHADDAPEGAPLAAEQAQAGTPAAACLDRTVDALQTRYEKVQDLRARFVQSTRPARLGGGAPDPVTSRGHMVVAKPARMRWVYEAPEESLVVSDGESLWIYDPAFGEAQRLPVGEGYLSGAAVQFLLGEGDLRREFEIALVSCDEGAVELALTPREPASYEKLHLTADPQTGTLLRTEIHDLLGNVTAVELSQLETNVGPAPELFRFVAPEGVSVIELEPHAAGDAGP